ncbi:hypothetical protein QLQ09_24200 [Brucella sp. NM4]|uniref:hypothetical protein n=1 Tax=Brucella sp. NM4 TaxID=3045175 RepID=UPI0024BCFE7B|nr:hypothetical protein [Brucella sp. NM4]WHS33930.1 hypothetical protein QLQ09_24200 [Brucella sp. NM4]
MKAANSAEWRAYKEWNETEIAKIFAEFSVPIKQAAARHNAETKPIWRHYYRWKRDDDRAFAWREGRLGGLLRNAVDAVIIQRRAGELGDRSLLSAVVVNIFSSRRRWEALRALQSAKKDEVAAPLKEVLDAEIREIKAARSARLNEQKEKAAQRRQRSRRGKMRPWLK